MKLKKIWNMMKVPYYAIKIFILAFRHGYRAGADVREYLDGEEDGRDLD